MPPVTQALLVANVALFLLTGMLGDNLVRLLALWPAPQLVLTAPWQLVTYSFLHGSLTHLFFNMFALWMFGSDLERVWGGRRFAIVWFASVIAGALAQILMFLATGSFGPVIGASAGVFGLLLCYGLLFPNRQLMLIFPPIPMSARTFVVVYGVLELSLGLTGLQPGVAHFAHLGGMLGGWLAMRYSRGRGWRGR